MMLMPEEEATMLEGRMRLAIRIYDFRPQEALLVHAVVDRTYARRRDRGLIPSLDYLVRLTRILRADVSSVLRRLEDEYGVIGSGPAPEWRARDRQDPRWYWCLPSPSAWRKIGPRVDREWQAQLHRELDFIEQGQGHLALPDGSEFTPAQMPGLKTEIAASSHADALADERQRLAETTHDDFGRARPAPSGAADARDVCGNSAQVGVGNFRTHTESPNTPATCWEIPYTSSSLERAPAGARKHVHVPPSVPQSMLHDHDHARGVAKEGKNLALNRLSDDELLAMLDGESRYAMDVMEEVIGTLAPTFTRLWLLRLCDRHRSAALSAIGETKRMKLAGQAFKVGAGACMNDLFHRFKKAHGKEAR